MKIMVAMLEKIDIASGGLLTEGMNKGKKLTFYTYEMEKVKQLCLNVRRMATKRQNSKSTKLNTLRSIMIEMDGAQAEGTQSTEGSQEAQSTEGSQEAQSREGSQEAQSTEGSQVVSWDSPVVVLDDLEALDEEEPIDPEEIQHFDADASEENHQEIQEDQVPEMSAAESWDNIVVDLVESDPDLGSLVNSDAESFSMDSPEPVSSVPVPEAVSEAEKAPLLQHALQRKQPARRKEKDGKKKKQHAAKKRALANKARKFLAPRKAANGAKGTAVAAVKGSRKETNGAKAKAVARFRLQGKQPVEEVKRPRPAERQVRPAVPAVYRVVRSVERAIEIFQVKSGGRAWIQVTAPMAGGRQLAIQWIGILKDVLEAGGTQAEARTVKEWLKNGWHHLWGGTPLHQVTGAEILRSVHAQPVAAAPFVWR